MKRLLKWLAAITVVLVLLFGGLAMALQHWVGSDDFRGRAGQQLSAALGVPVQLGGFGLDVWPLPAVALDQVQIKSRPPLTLERIEVRPAWTGLLQGRLEIATLIVRRAVLPEQAVAAIAAALKKSQHDAARGAKAQNSGGMATLPRRTVLDDVSWVDAKGGSITVNAQAQLDDDGLPAAAQVEVRKGRFAGAELTLQRQADLWELRAQIGGGTVMGKLQVKPAGRGGSSLQGQLTTANVEVAALTAPSRTLTGRLEAHTTLQAQFHELGEVADALQTQTRFTVHDAVVHGIDLAQAVKAVGLNRGGETRLNTLAGVVTTHGRTVQLRDLAAASGALSAAGNVTISPDRSLKGRVTVDLASKAAGGNVGVPLAVGGTVDSPSVMLTREALIGAAVGAATAPPGDRLSQALRGLLGK
jgi:uncharacterized protein involved in outer membrane biogenesis